MVVVTKGELKAVTLFFGSGLLVAGAFAALAYDDYRQRSSAAYLADVKNSLVDAMRMKDTELKEAHDAPVKALAGMSKILTVREAQLHSIQALARDMVAPIGAQRFSPAIRHKIGKTVLLRPRTTAKLVR